MNAPTSDDALRVPRWLLAFVLPAVGLVMAVARMEYRTNQNERETAVLEVRLERSEERATLLERQVHWLCAQRARDDFESNRTGAGTCP